MKALLSIVVVLAAAGAALAVDNVTDTNVYKFGTGENAVLRTTESAGVHTPHVIVDTAPAGGAVTIADGANVAQGATTDAAASSDTGTFSIVALFKRSLQKLTTIAGDTGSIFLGVGNKNDSAASTDTGNFSLIALFKRSLQTLTSIATNTQTIATNTTGAQYTISPSVVTASGTVAAGKHHIEFVLSSDFAGTIGGAAIDPAVLAVYSPGDAPAGSTFAALSYTISAGNAVLTTW